MKNICVFLMFVLVVCGGGPVYATTDIAADAENSECTENITGTYSGDANFKAKWRSNVIQLNWYNNNTLMQGVNTESNTCNYGTTLTIPTTPPERAGYIFDGWKVRPKFDFATLAPDGSNALSRGSERWTRVYYDNHDYCRNKVGTGTPSTASCADNAFSDLDNKEWKVEFRSGTTTGMLYGSAYFSAKSGNHSGYTYPTNDSSNWLATYDELKNATGEKLYCWCQVTGWKPYSNNPNGTIYRPSSASVSSVWVLAETFGYSKACQNYCVNSCSERTLQYSAFRRALFVGGGN